jgi:prepilin-type N-terminal cleavage/methylation domain-containing protein
MVNKHKSRSGFTLVELLVVIIIVALLSALTLGALRTGGIRAKEDSARSFIVHISDSLLELFEELDDQGMASRTTVSAANTHDGAVSYDIRWQLPVSRLDAFQRRLGNLASKSIQQCGDSLPPFGSMYNSYGQNIGAANESAECLYMIMTQTGYFADFLETLHETQVADTDGNGLNEFVDTWGTAIRLEFSPATPNNLFTFQNLPVIRSAGVDLEFGTDDDIVSIDLVNEIFIQ